MRVLGLQTSHLRQSLRLHQNLRDARGQMPELFDQRGRNRQSMVLQIPMHGFDQTSFRQPIWRR